MTFYKLFLTISLSVLPVLAKAQVTDAEILRLVGDNDSYVREVRRHLHLYPELGGKETETVKFLKRELARIGNYDIHNVKGSTGFYAVLDTHRDGPTIGLRTDIDGLPIEESPLNGGGQRKPWVSRNIGVTHGCGHDGHMSMLLGAAQVLWQLRDRLSGRIILIFEEGEETNTGIRPMIAALRDFHFDAIYGNHMSSLVPTGQLFVKEGPIMAGMVTLALRVNGKGGHASRPDHAVSPIPAAAEVVTALGQAWVNQRDQTQTVTLGITQMEGGKVYNVIPNSVFVGGTMRFFNLEEGEHALHVVKKVSESVAAAHGCAISYDSVMQVNLPPVVNDTHLSEKTIEALSQLYPTRVVNDNAYTWWASETFALYQQLAPTVFLHVGTRNDATGITAAHHTDTFDLDEDALQYGVGALVRLATPGGTPEGALIPLPDMDPEGGADQTLATRDKGTGTAVDYYHATSDSVLTILPHFHTMLQTTEWTCGNVSALMTMRFLGINRETEASLAEQMHTMVDSDTPNAKPGSAKRLLDLGTSVGEMHRYFAAQPDLKVVSSSYRTDYAPDELLTDTQHIGEMAAGNLKGRFPNYDKAGAFLEATLKKGLPIIVNWTEWGGHWTVVIGYDNGGTPNLRDDDLLVMADPYDTFDRLIDGYVTVPLTQFFYNWQGLLGPKPWQLQPFIVIDRKKK